jgi:hypothetical protein
MGRISWGRVLLCGLAAGLAWTILSSLLTLIVGHAFVVAVPGGRLSAPRAGLVALLFALNLAMGIWAMWLYAAIRPRYGAGPKTAAVAGFSWWVISSLVDATWGSFGFVPAEALLGPMAVSLPALIVSAMVGAWPYRE